MNFSKPRVAVYYDVLPSTNFRNDGMPLWILWNMRKLIDGDTLDGLKQSGGFTADTNVSHLSPINKTGMYGSFDLHILVDYGEDSLGIPLDWELPHPSIYWIADTHIDEKGYQYRLNRAKQFDHIFLVHKAQIAPFIRDGIDPAKIHYMPVAAEPDCYRPYPIMKKWEWCFIGHLNSAHRIDLVDRFVQEFDLGDGRGYLGWRIPQLQGYNVLDDAAKKFSMSRLALNYSIKSDLNMRVMEAMATGTCLLTDEIEPLLELFEPGRHLLTFRSIDEAAKKAKMILQDEGLRAEIAAAGLKEVLDKHTYRHRALEMLKTSLNWEPKGDLLPC